MSRRRLSADMAATMYNNKTEAEFGRLLLLGWRARQLRRKLNRHTARNSRIARALGRRWRWTCPGCLTQWTGPCREHAPGGILDLDCAQIREATGGPLVSTPHFIQKPGAFTTAILDGGTRQALHLSLPSSPGLLAGVILSLGSRCSPC